MLEVNKIYLGDSLNIMKELPDKSVDLVLTDVPYNISRKSNGLRKLDYGEWDKQRGMERFWIKEIIRVSRGTVIVFCGNEQLSLFARKLRTSGFSTRSLVWHKSNPTVINCNRLYVPSTELAVYGKLPKATYNQKYKHNIFEYPAVRNRIHPNQKPLPLFRELILDTTKEGDLVLDPFSGSGVTAIACLEMNRKFICIERDEKFYNESLKRMEEFLNV